MSYTIIFMIFGLTQSYMIGPHDISDAYSTDPIHQCANHRAQCNIHLDNPCCDRDNKCTSIRWANDQYLSACLKPTKLGESCEYTSECSESEYVTCDNIEKKCVCSINYIEKNNKCVPLLAGYCWADSDCAVNNSVCIGNRCSCKPSYVRRLNSECLLTLLGTPCELDDDCKATANTKCLGNCVCRSGYREKNNNCATYLSNYCRNYKECWPENSACIDNSCQCQFKYISSFNDRCLPVPVEVPCKDDYDCNRLYPISYSIEKKFVCVRQYSAEKQGKCLPLLEEFCEMRKPNACAVENSVCYGNRCVCISGFIAKSKDECVKN